MRIVLNFGSGNTLQNPSWLAFENASTGTALSQPPVYENYAIPGQYYFDVYWAGIASSVTTVSYSLDVNGTTLAGTLDRPTVDVYAPTAVILGPGTGSQNLALYPTAKTVLNRAATQVTQQPVDDPYTETNPDWVLLRDLLISLGRDVLKAPQEPWTHLVRQASFVTDGISTSVALPSDFRAMVDNTLWNRSMRLPGIGPMTAQQRAALQARLVTIVLNITFRVEGNVMTFPVVQGSGHTIAFDYYSTNWVQTPTSVVGPDKDRPSASTDVLLFDEEALVSGLVLRFLENRGYDTQKAEERFQGHLEDAIGRNAGSAVMSLGGNPRNVWDRMVGISQVPEGNWPA